MKLSQLVGASIDNATIEIDPDGQHRVIFSGEEISKINSYLKREIDAGLEDYTPVWNTAVENYETYRTVKIPIPDGGQSVYPAPIARIPADQIIASVYNAIIRPRPIFAVDSYLSATYNVPSFQSTPGGLAGTTQYDSRECAHIMEQGYEFLLRERIGFPQKLLRGIRAAVIGMPFWWKVVVDPDQHTSFTPKVNGRLVDLSDPYEAVRMRGDIIKWYLVPFTNCMMPIGIDDPDEASWFWERKPMRPDELAKKYAAGELFLIPDDTEAAALAMTTGDNIDQFRARAMQSAEKKIASVPAQVCNTGLIWFYWDVNFVDPADPVALDGKSKRQTRRLSLLGDFHLDSGKLMSCYINPYRHQMRPYELVDQMDGGDCTVDRLRYHQTMFTYAGQSEIKAAHHRNNLGFWFDPNNPDIKDFFTDKRVLGMGDHIPGRKDTDWGTVAFGEGASFSMLSLMQFFLSMSQLDSRENDFTMGGRPPGRTPSATVAQVYQHADETKMLLIERISLKLARLMRLDAETRRQYQPLGEVLPIWDGAKEHVLEIPFRFPVGDVLDNFRFALTAADQALSAERDPQQIMMRKQALMADGEYVAKVVSAIVNIQQPLPPTAVTLFSKIVERNETLMRKIMGLTENNEEAYDLTPEIQALVDERNQALQAKQAQQALMQAQGGQVAQGQTGSSIPAPGGGAGPPGGAGPNAGPPAEPGVPVPATVPPAQAAPPAGGPTVQ